MKKIISLILLTMTSLVMAGTNLSDAIDENKVPAEIEEREEETINRPDAIDKNDTPATLEDRQREEKWREDYDETQYDTIKRQNKEKRY